MIDPRLKNKIRNYIRKTGMLQTGDRVLLGVSGGADSVFLCVLMQELAEEYDLTLRAVHVHHGIRGADADADEQFVRNFCEERNLPLVIHHRNVPLESEQSGETLEEAGRSARYQCFREDAEKWDREIRNPQGRASEGSGSTEGFDSLPKSDSARKREQSEGSECTERPVRRTVRVAIAHHMDDQAETVLFRIARGTGIRGLKGMEPVREEREAALIRPLLWLRKEEIRNALRDMNAAWREDATNADDNAARNRLRHDILPLLETEVNARSTEHLAELAARASEADALIRKCADEAERETLERTGTFRILLKKNISGQMAAVKRELVLRVVETLAEKRKDLGSRHVEAVLGLFDLERGSRLDLPYGLTAVRVEHGVEIRNIAGAENAGRQRTVHLTRTDSAPDPIPEIKYTKWLDYDKINNTAVVRTRETGDYLTVDAEGHRKSLSDYFTDAKVPKEERGRIPLVADGHEIMWVVGYRIGYSYRVTAGTRRFLRADAVDR